MGILKREAEEADERGWNKPDGYVCSDCVEDEFLKDIIRENACQRECDYCGRRTRSHSAAPVSELMEAISDTVYHFYNDPSDAGMPYESREGGWLIEPIDTREMLESLLECNDQFFDDIASAFVCEGWVETASGTWTGSHPHELMSYSWDSFVDTVKHKSRYFFQQSLIDLAEDDEQPYWQQEQQYNTAYFLPMLEELIKKQSLLRSLPSGIPLFRARLKEEGKNFDLNSKELGAPPSERAKAGRMNPIGISYLYVAFNKETALKEVQYTSSQQAAIGEFKTQRELQILDLTNLGDKPSIFDNNHREEFNGLFFLEDFVKTITKLIEKNGNEHLEYVPSQVVSEYFALMFRHNGKHLDGIKYSSAVYSNGYNLVLFPTERSYKFEFNQVAFVTGEFYLDEADSN
jgi:hypothetical protein